MSQLQAKYARYEELIGEKIPHNFFRKLSADHQEAVLDAIFQLHRDHPDREYVLTDIGMLRKK
jgi:hypothetical protein